MFICNLSGISMIQLTGKLRCQTPLDPDGFSLDFICGTFCPNQVRGALAAGSAFCTAAALNALSVGVLSPGKQPEQPTWRISSQWLPHWQLPFADVCGNADFSAQGEGHVRTFFSVDIVFILFRSFGIPNHKYVYNRASIHERFQERTKPHAQKWSVDQNDPYVEAHRGRMALNNSI